MSIHPLKLTDDEIQRLLTRVYSETGYRLDRNDPIIVQYVVQRILLRDFDENQVRLFDEFSDRIMPALKAEAKRMEEQKNRLWDLSRSAAADVVHRSGEEYTQHIRDTVRKTDEVMLKNLKDHITRLRDEQNSILSKLKEKHWAFTDTAAQFTRAMWYLFVGNVALVVIAAFIAAYFIKK